MTNHITIKQHQTIPLASSWFTFEWLIVSSLVMVHRGFLLPIAEIFEAIGTGTAIPASPSLSILKIPISH